MAGLLTEPPWLGQETGHSERRSWRGWWGDTGTRGHGDGGIGEAVDRRAATASCFCGILSRMRAFVFCVAPVYDAGQVEMYLLNSAGLYLLWPVS